MDLIAFDEAVLAALMQQGRDAELTHLCVDATTYRQFMQTWPGAAHLVLDADPDQDLTLLADRLIGHLLPIGTKRTLLDHPVRRFREAVKRVAEPLIERLPPLDLDHDSIFRLLIKRGMTTPGLMPLVTSLASMRRVIADASISTLCMKFDRASGTYTLHYNPAFVRAALIMERIKWQHGLLDVNGDAGDVLLYLIGHELLHYKYGHLVPDIHQGMVAALYRVGQAKPEWQTQLETVCHDLAQRVVLLPVEEMMNNGTMSHLLGMATPADGFDPQEKLVARLVVTLADPISGRLTLSFSATKKPELYKTPLTQDLKTTYLHQPVALACAFQLTGSPFDIARQVTLIAQHLLEAFANRPETEAPNGLNAAASQAIGNHEEDARADAGGAGEPTDTAATGDAQAAQQDQQLSRLTSMMQAAAEKLLDETDAHPLRQSADLGFSPGMAAQQPLTGFDRGAIDLDRATPHQTGLMHLKRTVKRWKMSSDGLDALVWDEVHEDGLPHRKIDGLWGREVEAKLRRKGAIGSVAIFIDTSNSMDLDTLSDMVTAMAAVIQQERLFKKIVLSVFEASKPALVTDARRIKKDLPGFLRSTRVSTHLNQGYDQIRKLQAELGRHRVDGVIIISDFMIRCTEGVDSQYPTLLLQVPAGTSLGSMQAAFEKDRCQQAAYAYRANVHHTQRIIEQLTAGWTKKQPLVAAFANGAVFFSGTKKIKVDVIDRSPKDSYGY